MKIHFRLPAMLLLLFGLAGSTVTLLVLLPMLAHYGGALTHTPASSSSHGGWWTFGHLLLLAGISCGVGVTAVGWWVRRCVRRRRGNRLARCYELYELSLSLHDQAREQEVIEMVEQLLHVVREFPEVRLRHGQPFVAIEMHYGVGESGEWQWTLCVRCECKHAQSVEAAIKRAYPETRLGVEFSGPPQPIKAALPEPGHVLRFAKARRFIFPLAERMDPGAVPLEAIAQAQVALGLPSSVRFQLTPCGEMVERIARSRAREYEEDHPSLRSVSGAAEASAAAANQNHAWCWLEVQVACDTREHANQIAAAVVARRGPNRLRRRWMIGRQQDLYRNRFPTAYPPLLPGPRSLVSVGEIARLIMLPSARMRDVPVHRQTLPRMTAPPQVGRLHENPQPQMPPNEGKGEL